MFIKARLIATNVITYTHFCFSLLSHYLALLYHVFWNTLLMTLVSEQFQQDLVCTEPKMYALKGALLSTPLHILRVLRSFLYAVDIGASLLLLTRLFRLYINRMSGYAYSYFTWEFQYLHRISDNAFHCHKLNKEVGTKQPA